MERKFMGSEEAVGDLPPGYKERMDKATLSIMPQARRVMEICGEFCCNNVVLTDGDIKVTIEPNDQVDRRGIPQVPAPCSCSVWPCPTCGAVDWEDAGNKCKADWVCAADDQRQLDYEREQSTPNAEHHARPERSERT